VTATRPSALSAARAGVGLVWCSSLLALALVFDHPAAIAATGLAVLVSGILCGAGRTLMRTAMFTVPLALTVALVNALVSRDGVTVLARLGTWPVLGRVDITAESLVYGSVLALRVVVVSLAVALFASCVDQDAVLALLRRRSGRFGLAVAVSARLLPLLISDGRRMDQARKLLPEGSSPSRAKLLGALATGALDRAADTAAALELRGLGDGPCLAAKSRMPWSRHDIALVVSALLMITACAVSVLTGWAAFSSSSRIEAASGPGLWLTLAVVPLIAAVPMLDRRGVEK
jgi:energy-coupling factor transport system permease protein